VSPRGVASFLHPGEEGEEGAVEALHLLDEKSVSAGKDLELRE
jgi:hypothetical protein